MALPTSGQIDLNAMHVEAGGSSGSACTINDTDIRGLIGKSSGAQMAFNEWYGASAASGTTTYLGRSATTTNQFGNGYRTLSSGTKLVVVVPIGLFSGTGNTNGGPTSVSCGGTAMTKAVGGIGHYNSSTTIGTYSSIWYLETTQSGSTLISGSGTGSATGPNYAYTFEISGYNSATPYATASANNQGSEALSDSISVNGQGGGVTLVVGGLAGPGTASVNNGLTLDKNDNTTFTTFFVSHKDNISSGSQTYTVTKTTNTQTNSAFSLHAISFG